ncbi:MAG: DUF2232 domain-containing protein [Nitrospina sp.]|nr:DUF2232 domain-containing protein [Nitrospina sp.]MBT3510602.1 DUF2232 domain-containing protein [Nitrospina sp.]MBT3875184.1 DUF2232 domain-containing protein [Nitrospina sp.]MBT4049841.1 DUF2232 domain-containing protein [Nitrospina sp.]MBT4556757.1 DUF2232 domain-containing protein [Nitrospina sp.]
MPEPLQQKKLLVPVVLVFFLFFALMVFPPLGALVGVLSPFPIIFLYLQRGRQVGIILIALIFVMLLLLVGPNQAMLFLAEYALLALLMGEMIRFRLPGDRCIGISALASGFVSIVLLLALFSDQDTSVKAFFEEQIRAHFSQSMEAFESMGENKTEVAEMKAFAERTAEVFAASYPAFLLIGSLIGAAANYALIRIAWTRLYGPGLFSGRTFSEWVCSENLIWGFILSGAALFLGQGMLADAGLNIFLVMLVIYFAQGLSIVVHFLKARNVQVVFWFVLFILIFVQPLLIGLVAGLGVFDIWADFRKLRSVEDIT